MDIIVQAPVAIAFLDNNMRYVAHSAKWCSDYQLTYKDLKGMHHYKVFPEIVDEWKMVHERVLKGMEDSCDQELFIRKDGRKQWIKWSTKPWHDYDGNIAGLVIVSEDITDFIEQKERDQRNYDLLFKACNEVNIGTWEYSNITGDLYWSEATKNIHEVDPDYEPKADTALEFYKEGKYRSMITEAFIQGLTKGVPYDLELKLITAKNNLVWVRARGISEHSNGTCIRMFGTFEDITNKKLLDL